MLKTNGSTMGFHHSEECSDSCQSSIAHAFIVKDQGEYLIVVAHDTDCHDSEGEFCGNGAYWQTLASCDTKSDAEETLKTLRG